MKYICSFGKILKTKQKKNKNKKNNNNIEYIERNIFVQCILAKRRQKKKNFMRIWNESTSFQTTSKTHSFVLFNLNYIIYT